MSTKIKPVDDNQQKGKTYSALISKYNSAIKQGFYGEAELIVYAFLEDRLKSFIYYIDGLTTYNSRKTNENMQRISGIDDVSDISRKVSVIQKSIKASKDAELCRTDNYAKTLKSIYKYVNVTELKNKLKDIDDWRNYRNEVVHALFNKDLKDLHKGYADHIKKGFELARYIDSQVDVLKRI